MKGDHKYHTACFFRIQQDSHFWLDNFYYLAGCKESWGQSWEAEVWTLRHLELSAFTLRFYHRYIVMPQLDTSSILYLLNKNKQTKNQHLLCVRHSKWCWEIRFLLFKSSLSIWSEKAMAPYSSNLAWKIPRMEDPAGLPSMGSHRVEHDWSDLAAAAAASLFIIAWQTMWFMHETHTLRCNVVIPTVITTKLDWMAMH